MLAREFRAIHWKSISLGKETKNDDNEHFSVGRNDQQSSRELLESVSILHRSSHSPALFDQQ